MLIIYTAPCPTSKKVTDSRFGVDPCDHAHTLFAVYGKGYVEHDHACLSYTPHLAQHRRQHCTQQKPQRANTATDHSPHQQLTYMAPLNNDHVQHITTATHYNDHRQHFTADSNSTTTRSQHNTTHTPKRRPWTANHDPPQARCSTHQRPYTAPLP